MDIQVAGFGIISYYIQKWNIQGGSNMTGTVYTCLHTNQSRSYLNHLVYVIRTSNKCFLYVVEVSLSLSLSLSLLTVYREVPFR